MRINIIRGQNQIGGNIIEISYKTTKIILDVGIEIDEKEIKIPFVSGLFKDKAEYDAVLISHYHSDHIGLINEVLEGIPIYIGEKSYLIYKTVCEYFNKKVFKASGFLESGKDFFIDDINIKPILCDHSAFDSYMLLITCEDKKILYTGDFRATGRKSFDSMLKNLEKVDILISEGTTLTREDYTPMREIDLENKAFEIMSDIKAPIFVLTPATNIDRIVTFFKASLKVKRLFLEDVYMASVTKAVGNSIPNPKDFNNVRVFLTNPKHYKMLQKYENNKIGIKAIIREKFIMCVRSSMKNYLEKLSQKISFKGGILFYSMWSGYLEDESMKDFINFMESKGIQTIKLHTSGHADISTIDKLIEKVSPQYIIPIHTENSKWFEKYNNCNIIYDKEFTL